MANRRDFIKTVTASGAVGMYSPLRGVVAFYVPEDEKITIPFCPSSITVAPISVYRLFLSLTVPLIVCFVCAMEDITPEEKKISKKADLSIGFSF